MNFHLHDSLEVEFTSCCGELIQRIALTSLTPV